MPHQPAAVDNLSGSRTADLFRVKLIYASPATAYATARDRPRLCKHAQDDASMVFESARCRESQSRIGPRPVVTSARQR
jgi:hypothetical protein